MWVGVWVRVCMVVGVVVGGCVGRYVDVLVCLCFNYYRLKIISLMYRSYNMRDKIALGPFTNPNKF